MDALADELLKMILSPPLFVPDELFADGSELSPFRKTNSSASDVLLVCKRFLRIATPSLYETVIIRTKAQAAALQAALTRNPEFGHFVRKLRLEAAYELITVISTMRHVSEFCFTINIHGNESMATMEAAFATFQLTRVVLTLPQTRRNRWAWTQDESHITKRHRALAAALCAAIPSWPKLREFSYPRPTQNALKLCGEHDIATALAQSGSVQVVDVSAGSWDHDQLPPILEVLLSSSCIRQLRLHSCWPKLTSNSFLHRCQPEVRQRLLLVDSSASTAPDAPDAMLLEANPFYHPMQRATHEERVAMWTRIISFIIYNDASDAKHLPLFSKSWFDSDEVDLAVSRALILVSREVSEGLIAVLSRHLCFMKEGSRTAWNKFLEARPALGKEVRSVDCYTSSLAGDEEWDAFFGRMPYVRFLKLLRLTPAFLWELETISPRIGPSLRTLILGSTRKGYGSTEDWSNNLFSASIFTGLVALENLGVYLDDTRFTATDVPIDTLPNLKELKVGEVHTSFFAMLCRARLPKIEYLDIQLAVRNVDKFIEHHGAKIVRVTTTTGFSQKNLGACPNLESMELLEEVQPGPIKDWKHAHLQHLKLNWKTGNSRWIGKHRTLCNNLSAANFPGLREVLVGGTEEIWPPNERDEKKSQWRTLAIKLATDGIVLRDHTGRPWRQRM